MPQRPHLDGGGSAGCLTVSVVALLSCAMCVFNFYFTTGVLAAVGPHLPLVLQQPKVVQALLLILPTTLVFAEWWLVFTFGAALHHALFADTDHSRSE